MTRRKKFYQSIKDTYSLKTGRLRKEIITIKALCLSFNRGRKYDIWQYRKRVYAPLSNHVDSPPKGNLGDNHDQQYPRAGNHSFHIAGKHTGQQDVLSEHS